MTLKYCQYSQDDKIQSTKLERFSTIKEFIAECDNKLYDVHYEWLKRGYRPHEYGNLSKGIREVITPKPAHQGQIIEL